MSKNKLELLSGIFLIIIPFTGFPQSFKIFFYVIVGIIFVVVSFAGHVRRRSRNVEMSPERQDEPVFVEHPAPLHESDHVVHIKITEEI